MIATIVKHQWFSGSPLPLNEWFGRNHWYQWFFNGFWSINHWPRWFFSLATIGLDGFAMFFWSGNHWTRWFFNGSQPWNGNDPSLWSTSLSVQTFSSSYSGNHQNHAIESLLNYIFLNTGKSHPRLLRRGCDLPVQSSVQSF